MERLARFFKKIHTSGLYLAFRDAVRAIWPLWWSRDVDLNYQIQLTHTSQRLWRHYKKIIMQPIAPQVGEHSNIIWICWLQGEDKAPDIVKACIASIRKWVQGYEIRIITDKNLLDYATIPEYIISKYKKGKISFAHFSDILRTCLLYEHGGIWIDATVLLTGELPEEITNEPFFIFQNKLSNDGSIAISSWLIAANTRHPILKVTRDVLFAYWQHHNVLWDYFLIHLIFTLIVRNNPTCKALFTSMPYAHNIDVHTLFFNLYNPWDQKQWLYITKRSSIHKLTRRFINPELVKKEGTYYDYIVHNHNL